MKEIDESLSLIKEHLPSKFEEFSNLGLVKDGIYKKLEFCIESIIDICAIINTDLDLGIPEDEENILDNLTKNKILSKKLSNSLKSMKGFRNILVHRYGKINDEISYTIINENIDDFYKFIEEIEKFIEQKEKN